MSEGEGFLAHCAIEGIMDKSRVTVDAIIPVPVHPSRRRKRGFNQAELMATVLGKELKIPVRALLKKYKKTKVLTLVFWQGWKESNPPQEFWRLLFYR